MAGFALGTFADSGKVAEDQTELYNLKGVRKYRWSLANQLHLGLGH